MEESRRTSPTPQSPTAQRRLQACERCWKRKQKVFKQCDRLLPGCTACIEAKAKCCPRSVQLGGTTEDASGLSNAALPDYIETLKRKAEDLDDQSRRRRPRLSTNTSDGRPSLPSNGPTEAAHDSPQASHDTPLTEQTSLTERSVQAAMGEIEFLSRNAMAEPRGEASGFPQELTIGNMIKASLAISGKDPTQSSCPLSQKSKYSNMLGQTPTLTREVVADCTGRFFGHTKALCPYIDEGEMLEYRDGFFDSSHVSHTTSYTGFRDFNVYMATAIGMLLSPESGIELFASSLHSAAMQSFPTILGSNDDLNMLHSMQLMIIYSMFSSMGGSTWHLVGLAMKKAISYRFHKEPLSDIGIPEQKLNRRRNIFWNLYILDSNEYLAVEDGCFKGSFVDAFDIFSAGVVLICLGKMSPASDVPNAAIVLNKCTSLLTLLGERFSALKALCRVLWCLQESADMMAPSRDDELLSSRQTVADKPTVYLLDTFPPKAIEHAKTLFNIIQPQDEEFQNWRENARALLIRSSYLTAEDVASCPNLIAIGKHGVGIDKIDQNACAERGIKILNTPGANARDVAELVVALSLSVARGIRSITTRQMSKPVPKETCDGLTLYQKTVGIIGMGNIGRTVAEIFRGGFQTDIIAYDAYMPEDIWTHIPHTRASSIDEVITRADILSVHVPLTKETRDMISYDKICMMKPDAILINAARGGIVNEQDLTRALSEGRLWGAGLDCHEQEPPSHERYGQLWENLNVISTPHIGAATSRAQLACATAAIDNLHQYLASL
ncbi:D-3-phosphoglycerate dehydrogenase [Aspergillus luchuensis]|uniref:D-3-phosphoglycerate dehydrogenase n=2 Tax=Aspergillus kawachii TaxID=1069201 RepID=A0A146FFX1_ASPKA|nr:D-3-phosphoglycerate dehydrogenase [Aspergillus luchuensis]